MSLVRSSGFGVGMLLPLPLAVVLVATLLLLACQSPHQPVPRQPGPAFGPDGAWRELQNGLLTRNDVWVGSRISRAALPSDAPSEHAALLQLAHALLQHVAPRIDHALIVTDEPEVWLRFDRRGEFVGGRARLLVSVTPLALFDHGVSLAEWTARLDDEPDADPGEAQARFTIITHWLIEQDDWRLRHLEIEDARGESMWRLPTRPDT